VKILSIRFQIRTGKNSWGPDGGLTLSGVLNKLLKLLRKQNPKYTILRPDGDGYGPPKTRPKVFSITEKNLPKLAVGDVWKIRGENGLGKLIAIRKIRVGLVQRSPVFSIWDGSPDIQRLARVAAGFDYGVRSVGIAVTRKIAGTNTWSQHSRWPRLRCKSNAIDLKFPLPDPIGNDLFRQRRLVKFLLEHAYELNINMIISEKIYWSRANNFEPRYYKGISHVGHMHVEMYPAQTGYPC